jgi:hypothetical protein
MLIQTLSFCGRSMTPPAAGRIPKAGTEILLSEKTGRPVLAENDENRPMDTSVSGLDEERGDAKQGLCGKEVNSIPVLNCLLK